MLCTFFLAVWAADIIDAADCQQETCKLNLVQRRIEFHKQSKEIASPNLGKLASLGGEHDPFLVVLSKSAILFIATHSDDLLLLIMWFIRAAADKSGVFTARMVCAGQLVGFTVLVLCSLMGSFAQLIFPFEYLSLLGFAPLLIGLCSLWQTYFGDDDPVKDDEDDDHDKESVPETTSSDNDAKISFWSATCIGVAEVSAMTIVNGSDNLSFYVPVLASQSYWTTAVMIGAWYGMLFVLCTVAWALVENPVAARVIARYAGLVMPWIFIFYGLHILSKSVAWPGSRQHQIAAITMFTKRVRGDALFSVRIPSLKFRA